MNYADFYLSDQQLIDVLAMSKHPMAIHVSEDAVIQIANDAMISVWGKDKSVIGKTLEDALPELKGQPFIALFKRVWNEGITVAGTDTPANLIVDGQLTTFYFDYEYRAIKNAEGKTYAILHQATDVTERYLAKQREQEFVEELTTINEELTASNEEIMASNEELATINEQLVATTEELSRSREYLQQLNNELTASEIRFRQLINQAPIALCLIRANDLNIEEVNDAYLKLVGKRRDDFTGTIWEAVPETAEVYAPIMQKVIETGVPFIANEHELYLIRQGIEERLFINFVYEPITDHDGNINFLLVIGFEVTELVLSRQKIELAEQRSRLAVEAAGIGIFDLDLNTGVPLVSGRFNEIFDLTGEPGKHTIELITHPDDRAIRLAAHDDALKTGVLFYEARIIHRDESVHWIRAQGKVFYNERNQPEKMLGTVLDITTYKEVQQQKDDFISIASHELKTPITSLKVSLQLMDRIKDKQDQAMIAKLIIQSRKSVERVGALVDDLLNVSRLQQGDIEMKKSHFVMSQLVNAVANPISITTRQPIEITGDLEAEVFADEHRMDQVLANLLNNAVKYAPGSGLVVNIAKDDAYMTVTVKDFGPGIPADKKEHLFDRYYRVDPSGQRASGLGLGLYICAEIISRHNGEIGVDSVEGEGSTFWFKLPV